MNLSEIKTILDAELLCGEELLDQSIEYGYGCDLMSDVLAFVENNVVLLTGLVHAQVIRTSEMMDIKAIVFVRGKKPDEEMIKMASKKDIVLLTTGHSLFTSCGLLHGEGLKGEEIN